ncbi:tetratricopeptide repeat-containing glycosyltransferase family protein [Azospirillum sp. TSO35-2]|uniref:tetratricopeptide repeat-containing glycosyltransferase family protein n=1 Tax=Azospirillum sp. TSO35-2 TaxID=716796 RepID=UPI000D657D30|nr:tetratricopeptide repeat-containing glycosyltransferase family protein [Azospirillum sp. TSO35-2]
MTAPEPTAAFAAALRLHRSGEWTQALAVYDRLLGSGGCGALAPAAYANRGAVLRRLGRLDDAVASCVEAVIRRPDLAEAYATIGAILQESDHPVAALDACRRAIALAPGLYTAYMALGHAFQDLGDHAQAYRALARSVDLNPTAASTRYNLAEALLQHGDFANGWRHYEARRHLPELGFRPADPDRREWTGQDLTGRTLLVCEEQGFGDTLQFVRLLPLVKALGARIILQCRAPLVRLLSGMAAIDAVVTAAPDDGAYDYRIPLMSLMHRLGVTLDRIPPTPDLSPPPEATARWAGVVPPSDRLTVGLVWAGDPKLGKANLAGMDARRSVRLDRLAPLLALNSVGWGVGWGVRWVSLQKGPAARQLDGLPDGAAILDPMGAVEDYADTAAIVRRLDLVIGVDTSVVHLAGALGTPVWVLSRFSGCWRWLLDRDDSPWYPTLRLFRQARPGDWDGVVERVREELLRAVDQHRHHRHHHRRRPA